MAEPWEEAQAREEQSSREREDAQRKEDRENEQRRESEERAREAAQQSREDQREKLANEREARERERSEAQEKRQEEAEKRQEGERTAERQVAAPSIVGFSGGGGPSFLLVVPQSGLKSAHYVTSLVVDNGAVAGIKLSTSLMGTQVVPPGCIWSVAGGYIKPPFWTLLVGNVGFAEKVRGLVGNGTVTTSVFRGASPIWYGGQTFDATYLRTSEQSLEAQFNPVIGIEFNSPVILGPGENLSLEVHYEAQVAWSEVVEGGSAVFLAIDTEPNLLGEGGPFVNLPATGAFRYNVEQIKEKGGG
jgi:hypothetical protein